jgi:hypothetical protein
MYIHRSPEARCIAINKEGLKAFLYEQQFEAEFVRDLGIFLLPEESDEEEDILSEESPVFNIIFLYVAQQSEAALNRRLLELIRECALEKEELPWPEASFAGVELVEDWDLDIKQFGELAEQHQFLTISEYIQLQEECDPLLPVRAVRASGRSLSTMPPQEDPYWAQLGMIVLMLVCLVRLAGWLMSKEYKHAN